MKLPVTNEIFSSRHIGINKSEKDTMLQKLGVSSLSELMKEIIPKNIALKKPLALPKALSEQDFLTNFRGFAKENKVFKSFIGQGYYNTFTPTVIIRNVLESPAWYTAYTPYQPEIAQGRLEALFMYQTLISDLTGFPIANASLLDEGTAAAEAMSMLFSLRKDEKREADKYFVDVDIFPQTIEVLKTRAESMGIKLVIGQLKNMDLSDPEYFGLHTQYPNNDGSILNIEEILTEALKASIKSCVNSDLLALTMLKPPGEMGADVVVGTSQRFGTPMGFGGPHAGFFATKEEYKRQIPGRIIGKSVDKFERGAFRMALQTREQHIRREKATSNICTAQVLLAVMSALYAVYHGKDGLENIAKRTHGLTKLLNQALTHAGFEQSNLLFFDSLKIKLTNAESEKLKKTAEKEEINFRYFENGDVGISLDETVTVKDIKKILPIFYSIKRSSSHFNLEKGISTLELDWPDEIRRKSDFLSDPTFKLYRSEHKILRYIRKLERKDMSLTHSMIPLGSCTMKLNATTEMIPLSWPEFSHIHPFASGGQTKGYKKMFLELESWLNEITGAAATSFQPNSGAQGEYAGLITIKKYLQSKNQGRRNVCLIPASAHGTNPASAVMAGMKVLVTKCDEKGNIDVEDLTKKAEKNKDVLAVLMITYPSTHGVFEKRIREVCDIVHRSGGQVYMDGANMNAQVGLTSPTMIGADICHLNLHKTFCIPHGGGGPGAGPICAAAHLVPFLPKTELNQKGYLVSSAPYGNASILTISYGYIALMGAEGLKKSTETAILCANYMKARLEKYYPILYTGENERCAHEFILDCRKFKSIGIEVENIAKRLIDYGFHAPTVSFPVAGTLMIEPAESESMDELDRFCNALISIREEIKEIETDLTDKEDNVLKNAPHTAEECITGKWEHSYSREKAVYPTYFVKNNKFWPPTSYINNAFGDRNLVCSCNPVRNYLNLED